MQTHYTQGHRRVLGVIIMKTFCVSKLFQSYLNCMFDQIFLFKFEHKIIYKHYFSVVEPCYDFSTFIHILINNNNTIFIVYCKQENYDLTHIFLASFHSGVNCKNMVLTYPLLLPEILQQGLWNLHFLWKNLQIIRVHVWILKKCKTQIIGNTYLLLTY